MGLLVPDAGSSWHHPRELKSRARAARVEPEERAPPSPTPAGAVAPLLRKRRARCASPLAFGLAKGRRRVRAGISPSLLGWHRPAMIWLAPERRPRSPRCV